MKHIVKAMLCIIAALLLLIGVLAGCANETKGSQGTDYVADGAYDASPLPVPSASNEVYLDVVTKRALTHLVFFQLRGSEKIVEAHLLRKEAGALYDESIVSKHQNRVKQEADLLARIVSMEENDSEALGSAYNELLDMLEVSADPEAWGKIESTREAGAAEDPSSSDNTENTSPSIWSEGDARLDDLTKQNLISVIISAMDRAEFLVDVAYDKALADDQPDDPELLARQEEFAKMTKLLDRVTSTSDDETEMLEKEHDELRSIMGL